MNRRDAKKFRKNLEELTARELEILTLLSDGLRQADVAETLGIQYNTVRVHIYRMLQKLELHTTLQAVVFYLRTTIMEPLI